MRPRLVLPEVWFGNAEKVGDMVVVTVSEGIKNSVISSTDTSARGLHGLAGDVGHVSLDQWPRLLVRRSRLFGSTDRTAPRSATSSN